MPELPEVETTRRGIIHYLQGSKIANIEVRQPRLRFPVDEKIHEFCAGQTILAIRRRAKYLLFQLEQGHLIVHLGMSGHLRILSEYISPEKHDHIDLISENGHILRYCDPRRFGFWLYTPDSIERHPLFQRLGPEPLDEALDALHLQHRAKNRRIPVKTFLMDNHNLVGVGNIYANESLFLAGIHPLTPVNRLVLAEWEKLTLAIKSTLKKAIDAGGTTLKDFLSHEGKPGYFQQQLLVYGRGQKPCLHCNTTIEETKIAGRHSAYCPQCQPSLPLS